MNKATKSDREALAAAIYHITKLERAVDELVVMVNKYRVAHGEYPIKEVGK